MPRFTAKIPGNRLIPAIAALLLLALATACVTVAAKQPVASGGVRAIAVTATPQDFGGGVARARIGRLRFLGAITLTSRDREFGGISGIIWQPDCNRLLGVSDTGSWIILEPREEAGRLTGIGAAWLAPILDLAGRPPASKMAADAEELAQTSDGDVWVFYEQTHRAMRFAGVSACDPPSLARRPVAERRFAITAGWPANGGMEAATAIGQSLVAVAEDRTAAADERQGFIAGPDGGIRPFVWQPPADDFNPTAMDAFTAADGSTHLLVLHRRFSLLKGVAAAVTEARLDPGAPARLVGAPVAIIAPPDPVDNMEGLAVRSEAGRVQVYLVSDDNFNFVQRTILMKFELEPPAAAPPH